MSGRFSSGINFVNADTDVVDQNKIMNWATDGTGQAIYVGYAYRGSADSDEAWLIKEITNPTDPGEGNIRWSETNQVWDDRTTIAYK